MKIIVAIWEKKSNLAYGQKIFPIYKRQTMLIWLSLDGDNMIFLSNKENSLFAHLNWHNNGSNSHFISKNKKSIIKLIN